MNKEIVTFGDIKIDKRNFGYSKYPTNINHVIIGKMTIANKTF